MTIVTLYVLGKAEVMHRPGPLHFLKAVLALSPMALATFVAVSRIGAVPREGCRAAGGLQGGGRGGERWSGGGRLCGQLGHATRGGVA